MTYYSFLTEVECLQQKQELNVGDLVSTLLGEIGIVLGFDKHPDCRRYDGLGQTKYYKVLIDGSIYHYISGAIRKII